jgi:hypothetical protein
MRGVPPILLKVGSLLALEELTVQLAVLRAIMVHFCLLFDHCVPRFFIATDADAIASTYEGQLQQLRLFLDLG